MHEPVIVTRRAVGLAREQLLGIESQQDVAGVQKIQRNVSGAREAGSAGEAPCTPLAPDQLEHWVLSG